MAKQWVMTPARRAYYSSKRKRGPRGTQTLSGSTFSKAYKKSYSSISKKHGTTYRKIIARADALNALSAINPLRASKIAALTAAGRARKAGMASTQTLWADKAASKYRSLIGRKKNKRGK
jgi:hypothetical protein